MRSYAALLNSATNTPPFSNSTEGDAFTATWCDQCVVDRPAREGRYADACQILLVALSGKTPAEWLPQDRLRLGYMYRCTAFRRDRRPPPAPPPEVPGQLALWTEENQ